MLFTLKSYSLGSIEQVSFMKVRHNQGGDHAHDSCVNSAPTPGRPFADMAIQQFVGILSKRRIGTDFINRGDIGRNRTFARVAFHYHPSS